MSDTPETPMAEPAALSAEDRWLRAGVYELAATDAAYAGSPDTLNALFARAEAAEQRASALADILMAIACELELPRSESGPPDDALVYTNAIEALDLLYRQTEAERVRHSTARFAAEARLAEVGAALAKAVCYHKDAATACDRVGDLKGVAHHNLWGSELRAILTKPEGKPTC